MMTIMTCVDCGADLREWDFLKRRARLMENRPYCAVCRPLARGTSAEPVADRFPIRGAALLPRNRHVL